MKPKPFIDRIPENLPSSSQHSNQQSNVKIASSCNTTNSNNISISSKRNTFESIHKNDLDLSEDEDESHEKTKNTTNIHNSKRDDVNKNIQPLIKNENEMSQESQNNTNKNNANNKNSNNSNSIIGMKSGDSTKKQHDSTSSSSTQRQVTSNQNEKTQKIDINSLSKNLHSKDASNISNDIIKADAFNSNNHSNNNNNIKNSNSSTNYNNTNKNVKTVKVESGEINNEDEGSSSSGSSSDEGSSSSDDEADSTSAESSGSSSAASSSSSSSASSSDNEDDTEPHTSLKHNNKQLNTLQVDTVAAKLDKINEQKKIETNFIANIDDEEESNEELGSYFNRNPAHDEEDDIMNSGMTLTTLIKNIEENSNISPSKLMSKHTVDDVSSTSVATRKPDDDEENTFTFKFEDDELDDDSQTSNHNQNCLVANEHSSSVSVASVASNADKHAINDAKRTDIGSEHVSSVSTSAPESECFDTNVKSNESMMNNDCIDSYNANNRPESTSNFATSEMNEIDEDKHASIDPLEHENNASPVKRVITNENLADIDDNATYRDEESIKKSDINESIKSPYRPKDDHDSIKRQIQLFSPPSPLHSQEHNDEDVVKDSVVGESKANAVINLSFDNDDGGELHESNAPKLVQFDGANLFKKLSTSFLSASDEATNVHSVKENSIVSEISKRNELKLISVTANECVDNSNSDLNSGLANQVPLSAGFLISNVNPLSSFSDEVPSQTSNVPTPPLATSHTTATTTKSSKEAPSSTPKQKNRDESKKEDEPRSEKKHSKDKSSKKTANLSLEVSSSASQKAVVTQNSSPSKLVESKTHAKTSDVIASAANSKKDLIEKIQYDESGRPKLIMSIELDLLNICSQYISNSETKTNSKDLDSSSPKLKSIEFSTKSSSKTSRSRDENNDDLLNSSRSSSKSHKHSSTSKSRDGNERASKNDDRSSISPSKRQKSSSSSSKSSSNSSSKKESSHSSSSHSRSHHESHSHSHRHHGHHSHQHSSSNTSSSVLNASASESYSLKRMSSSDDLKKDTHKKPKYVDSTSPVKASKYEVTGNTNVSAAVNSSSVDASKSSLLSQSDKLQQSSVSLPSSVISSQLVASSADSSQNTISTVHSSQASTSTSSKIMSSINNSSSSSSANPTAIVKPIHFNSDSSKARQSKKPDDTRQKPKFDFLES